MSSMLRTRFGIPGVIATVALVFAMTGGAFAAKYLITSTSQIKPSVLKKLKGPAGPAGAAGAQGSQGPAGAAGAVGATGPAGKDGASVTSSVEPKGINCKEGGSKLVSASGTTYACNGKEGPEGEPGLTGEEGDPWTLNGTLPVGATETGEWGGFSPSGGLNVVAVSFPIPLAAQLDESHVHVASEDPVNCPGNANFPEAESGHLCFYIGAGGAVSPEGTILKGGEGFDPGASRIGAMVPLAFPEGDFVSGSWAVTG